MPKIDLSMLNQRQTPAFYADVLANRPAAGFVGRIFVSTNTYAFYRDNGTSWDLIGGPGTGTVTGSGTANQVAFWSGASLITGENNLWWDDVNNHFGINTNTPGTAADIHHNQSTVVQLNQTVATNDTRISFQNSGVSKWRIGSFYNGGSNDYAVNDAVLNINRLTIKSSSGQTFVGDVVTSSGLFVVNSSSSDAHIVALGASAPSIRVRNAGTGASLQFGLGLATTTNNFIQGATGGEFCIFNDSLTAQPILFGIKDAGLGNTQEAARISAARNFLIGTTTDNGSKLQINGRISGLVGGTAYNTAGLWLQGSSSTDGIAIGGTGGGNKVIETYGGYLSLNVNTANGVLMGGNVGIGENNPSAPLYITNSTAQITLNSTGAGQDKRIYFRDSFGSGLSYITSSSTLYFGAGGFSRIDMTLANATGNLLIGTTTDAGQKLQINGNTVINNGYLNVSGNTNSFKQGITSILGQDAGAVTLSTIFSNIDFSATVDIALQLQIIATTGAAGNSTAYIYNCVRDDANNWTSLLVSQVGTVQTVTLTFGGTQAAPTLTITGTPTYKSVYYQILIR